MLGSAAPGGWFERACRACAGGRKSLPVRANGIASYFPPVSSAAKRGFAAPRKSGRGNDENGEPAAAAAAGPVQGRKLCLDQQPAAGPAKLARLSSFR